MSHSHEMQLSPQDYAKYAVLAELAGDDLLEKLTWVTWQPRVILNMGCRTGSFSQKLQARYPGATLIATDVEHSMAVYARSQVECNVACSDMLVLPIKNQSVDMIFANMVLPWCEDVKALLAEWRRVLRPHGLLVFSGLGPDTLKMWRPLFGGNIIPVRMDMHDLGDLLTQGRFAEPIMDVDYFTLNYRRVEDFCRELEATGILLPVGLEAFGSEPREVYPAVFEVVYGHAWRPDAMADQTADKDGVVQVPVGRLGRRR